MFALYYYFLPHGTLLTSVINQSTTFITHIHHLCFSGHYAASVNVLMFGEEGWLSHSNDIMSKVRCLCNSCLHISER